MQSSKGAGRNRKEETNHQVFLAHIRGRYVPEYKGSQVEQCLNPKLSALIGAWAER